MTHLVNQELSPVGGKTLVQNNKRRNHNPNNSETRATTSKRLNRKITIPSNMEYRWYSQNRILKRVKLNSIAIDLQPKY